MSPVLTRKQLQLCLLHLLHQSPGVPRLLDPTLIRSVVEDEDEVVDEVVVEDSEVVEEEVEVVEVEEDSRRVVLMIPGFSSLVLVENIQISV